AQSYITMLEEDTAAGYSHQDDYRMSSSDYYEHIVQSFMAWHTHDEVKAGHWPDTLEACFGIEPQYRYPLSRNDAEKLTDYLMDVYAPKRSSRNNLRAIEGFVLQGPEYLTV